MKELVIMRGLPGSGKSFLANKYAKQRGGIVFSHDDYMGVGEKFKWDEDSSIEAHHANQIAVRNAFRQNVPLVIVDSCNLKPFLANPYVKMAKYYGYSHMTLMPATGWAQDPSECAKRNVHNVPFSVVQQMYSTLREIPIHVFNIIIDLENPFDPVECVREAQLAMELEKPFVADEMVFDFLEWQGIGGFLPLGAEDTIESIDEKLIPWRENYTQPVNWL